MTDRFLQRSAFRRQEFFRENAELLDRLIEKGQSPESLLITCSDARLMPTLLLDAKPGQFFIFRNVANLIPSYWQVDLTVAAVLEYAVCDLRLASIIICGHTDCAGIRAFEHPLDLSTRPGFSRWLDIARPAFLSGKLKGLKAESDEFHRAVVEQNVINQIQNLRSYPYVASRVELGELVLRGWVYYLKEREIRYYDTTADAFRLT